MEQGGNMLETHKMSVLDFAEGHETSDGLSCKWICEADNATLDKNEVWMRLAFPAWNTEDATNLTDEARANLILLAGRLQDFLLGTMSWKQPVRLARTPISQILLSLKAAGLEEYAHKIYDVAVHAAHPSENIRGYWDEALGFAPES